MDILAASNNQYEAVRGFYHSLIDGMKDCKYDIGWEKDIYPAPEFLKESMDTLQMYYEDTGWTDYELYEYVLK